MNVLMVDSGEPPMAARPRLAAEARLTPALVLHLNPWVAEAFEDASLVRAARADSATHAAATAVLEHRWRLHVSAVIDEPRPGALLKMKRPAEAVPRGMRAAGLCVALGQTGKSIIVGFGRVWPGAAALGCDYDGELGLGNGAAGSHWHCTQHGCDDGRPRPCVGLGAQHVVGVSALHRLTAFVTAAGECWLTGRAEHTGQWWPASPSLYSLPAPERVPLTGGLAGVRVCMAAAGFHHALLLSEDGRVFSLGGHDQHHAGRDEVMTPQEVRCFLPRAKPNAAAGAAAGGGTGAITGAIVRGVAAGKGVSFAYDAAGVLGVLWAWGTNRGHKTVTGHSPISFGDFTPVPRPVEALAGTRVVRVSAGLEHTVALDANGRAWSWGQNLKGQLGLGLRPGLGAAEDTAAVGEGGGAGIVGTRPWWEPALVPCPRPDLQFVSVAAGHLATAAVGTDGSVWLCGAARQCAGGAPPRRLRLERDRRGRGKRPVVRPYRFLKPKAAVAALVEARQFRGEGILSAAAGAYGIVFVGRGGACFVVEPQEPMKQVFGAPRSEAYKYWPGRPRRAPAFSWALGLDLDGA